MEAKLFNLALKQDETVNSAQEKLARWTSEGPPGHSSLIFFSAMATVINMIDSLIRNREDEDLLRAIICGYLAFFGVVIMMMEITVCFMTKSCKSSIEKWAKFLSRVWGRSFFYIYVGTVQISLLDWASIGIGITMVLMGIVGISISRTTATKMKKLQRLIRKNNSDDPAHIKRMFDLYDKDKSGYLDRKELYNLSVQLGCPLEGTQLDSAMRVMDKDKNGRIGFEEFMHWWTGSGKLLA
jgi:hypothetical protein